MELNLTAMLNACTLVEAPNVSRLLDAGASVDLETDLAARADLLTTYRARQTHLAQFDTHHAKRLARSTDELVGALEALPDDEQMIAHARVDDTLLGSYVVWFLPSSAEVLGALYIIGRSEVPAPVWRSIWEES